MPRGFAIVGITLQQLIMHLIFVRRIDRKAAVGGEPLTPKE